MENEDTDPSWLTEETPLMGTGSVPLQDPKVDAAPSLPTPSSASTKTKDKSTSDESGNWMKKETKETKKVVVKRPRKNPILHVFHFVEFWAVVGCLCLIISQLAPLFLVPISSLGVLKVALQCYVALFAVIFILVETESPLPFIKKAHLLQTYFSRGFLYTFLSLVSMEEAISGRVQDMVEHQSEEEVFHVAWAPLFVEVSSWVVFGIGLIYMVFGMCCLKLLRDNLHRKYRKEKKEYQRVEDEEGEHLTV